MKVGVPLVATTMEHLVREMSEVDGTADKLVRSTQVADSTKV